MYNGTQHTPRLRHRKHPSPFFGGASVALLRRTIKPREATVTLCSTVAATETRRLTRDSRSRKALPDKRNHNGLFPALPGATVVPTCRTWLVGY